MPKVNNVITNPGEIMKKWAEDHVEIYKNEQKNAEKGFLYENGIYKLIYGRAKSNFAEEKEIMINEYFADLFDTKEIKWKIKNGQNQENKPVRDLFLKYLQKGKFELKSWMAKYRSGRYGIYSLVINKVQTESVDKNGIAITEPIILPAFVNYKNTRNGEIFEVSVNYQDNIIHGLSLYTLTEVYSVNNNKVSVTRSVWDIQKTREIKKPKKELSPATYANYRFDRIESLSQSFLPVAIMPVNLHEKPRCHKIKSKLEMMEKYEEISAILPHWEKGGIMTTSDQVDNPNEEKNNNDFINYLLLKGMVRMKPIVGDGQVFYLLTNQLLHGNQTL